MRQSMQHNGLFGEPAGRPSVVTKSGSDLPYFQRESERLVNDGKPFKSSFLPKTESVNDLTSFNQIMENTVRSFQENNKIDIRVDGKEMARNPVLMQEYKEAVTRNIFDQYGELAKGDPHFAQILETADELWDNKVKLWSESAQMTGFLPISTLDFPVLLKQFFRSIIKDIIEVEATKTPLITKHIRSTFLVDNQTGAEYEYPKCMFDGTWEEVFEASTGYVIRNDVVPFTNGRLSNYCIISNLTDGVPGFDKLSFNTHISHIQVGSEIIRLRGNGIRIDFATGGVFINGDIRIEHNGTLIEDVIAGKVNFTTGLVDLASTRGEITGVVFSGRLSNEKNMRSVSVMERRDQIRIEINDGPRWNMGFTIEEINDASALLDMNYFNRMADEIVITQEMQETMTVIRFLQHEFEKYNGITTDIYNLESVANTYHVSLVPRAGFAGDPFKYMARTIQFRLKAIIHHLTEMTKLDNISFVVVGNPMATQLLGEFASWGYQQGTNIGGIAVNGSYGFMTDMSASVRIVASNLYDPYTVNEVQSLDDEGAPTGPASRELILHIYGYPTTEEHISFRHLKYTSQMLTTPGQSAYLSQSHPGGAHTMVTATSRFHSFAVQGIQARLIILNSAEVYGPARPRLPVTGAPWSELPVPQDVSNPPPVIP